MNFAATQETDQNLLFKPTPEREIDPAEYAEALEAEENHPVETFASRILVFCNGVAKYVFDNGYKIIVYQDIDSQPSSQSAGSCFYAVLIKGGNCVCRIKNIDGIGNLNRLVCMVNHLKSECDFFYIEYETKHIYAIGAFAKYGHIIVASSQQELDEELNRIPWILASTRNEKIIGKINIKKITVKDYFYDHFHRFSTVY